MLVFHIKTSKPITNIDRIIVDILYLNKSNKVVKHFTLIKPKPFNNFKLLRYDLSPRPFYE